MSQRNQPLQPSRYNFFTKRPEGTLGFNARTGSFALLGKEVADRLTLSGPFSADDPVSDTQCTELVEMGFLHAGDEVELIAEKYEACKQIYVDHAGLTIAPTMHCNYNCVYCYEKGRRTWRPMSVEVQSAVVRFAEELFHDGVKHMSLVWYGGEPLLAADVVFSLNDRLRTAAERGGAKLEASSIISNGILLDRTMSDRLSQ
jgi:uncharacterized protein